MLSNIPGRHVTEVTSSRVKTTVIFMCIYIICMYNSYVLYTSVSKYSVHSVSMLSEADYDIQLCWVDLAPSTFS